MYIKLIKANWKSTIAFKFFIMAGGKKRFLSRKNEVKDFCAHTSAHGLGQAAAASSWKTRILWLLIFISAFIVAATQIYMTIHDFLQYPTQTKVTLVKKERLAFPGVTICNLNPVTRTNIINTSLWRNIVSIYFPSTFCICCWLVLFCVRLFVCFFSFFFFIFSLCCALFSVRSKWQVRFYFKKGGTLT